QNIERNGGVGVPGVGSRDGDKLRPRARAIDANALGVGAKMPPAGQTVAAMSAGNVTFADDKIALGKPAHIAASAINLADELVPDRHRDRYGFLCPGFPFLILILVAAVCSFQRGIGASVWGHFGKGSFSGH